MKFYLYFITTLACIGCSAQIKTKVNCKILNANFSNYTVIDFENKAIIASDSIINNILEIELEFNNYGIHYITFTEEDYLIFYPEKDGHIQITFDTEDIFSSTVIGSNETKYAYKFHKELDEDDSEVYFWNEIDKNPAHITYTYYFQEFVDTENEDHLKKVQKVIESIGTNRNLSHLSDFNKYLNIKIGGYAPNIIGENQFGVTKSLSNYTNQIILIEFWASWCGPCTKSNKTLVQVYKDYKSKGFEIFSFSLDTKKEAWLKAIKRDESMNWIHICDFKGYNSQTVKNYGITSLPNNVLIDKKGLIIGKDLGTNELIELLDKTIN